MASIKDFIIFLFLIVLVLIPAMMLVMLLRIWVIRKITIWKLRHTYQHYRSYGLDPANVPVTLHELIPFAKKWGLPDNQRHPLLQNASEQDRLDLSRVIRGKETALRYWLAIAREMQTKEVETFRYLLKTIQEMDIIVEAVNTETALQNASLEDPLFPASRTKLIYYVPRPKTRLEKFVYDLFTAILLTMVCPLFYYLLGKLWYFLLPDFQPDYGIGLLSIFTALFTYSVFAISKNLIIKFIHFW